MNQATATVSAPSRRRSSPQQLIAVLGLVAMMAAACGSSASEAAIVDPQATSAPEATAVSEPTTPPEPTEAPEPTVAPTEVPTEPTVAPTEVPTEAPEPTPTAQAGPAPASAGCGLSDPATSGSIDSGGETYEWFLNTPAGFDNLEPTPLILNFHGIGSSGTEQQLFSALDPAASAAGFLTVYPTGVPAAGDDRNSWELAQFDSPDRDDVQFVADLIDTLALSFCLDRDRVFSTGMSNGGLFTSNLVCRLGDHIAAAASVAGVTHDEACSPDTVTPYIAFHGVDDLTVPFNGGGVSNLGGAEGPQEFFDQVMPNEFAEFATDFGCGEPVPEQVSDNVIRYDYPGCDNGAELSFFEVVDGGHTWPGSPASAAISEGFGLGFTNTEIVASELIVDFFSQY